MRYAKCTPISGTIHQFHRTIAFSYELNSPEFPNFSHRRIFLAIQAIQAILGIYRASSVKMPRNPSFSFIETSSGWKVEIPSTLSQSGKRERAFFKTRDKARDFAQAMEE
jgi:hypothetical protein